MEDEEIGHIVDGLRRNSRSSVFELLEKLGKLRENGILTEEDFHLKRKSFLKNCKHSKVYFLMP